MIIEKIFFKFCWFFQVKIHELIKNPDTFLVDIEESLLPQYNSWLEIIDDQLSTETLTKQLVASPGYFLLFFYVGDELQKSCILQKLLKENVYSTVRTLFIK